MKNYCLVFLFSIFSINCYSSDKIHLKYRYSLSGIGLSQQKISFLSPTFYRGFSFSNCIGIVRTATTKISSSSFESNFDINYSHFSAAYFSAGIDYRVNNYYLLRPKNYPEILPDLFIGFGYWLDTDFYIKPNNQNNAFYYNLNNLVCFSFYCEKMLNKIKFSYELNFPLAGIFSASEYGSGIPYFLSEKGGKFLQAFEIGSLFRNLQVDSRFNVDFKIKIKKRIRTFRAQYSFSGDKFSLNGNTKHNTFHALKVGYLFNNIEYEHK